MNNSRNHPINCGLASTNSFPISFAKQQISDRSVDFNYSYVNRIVSPSQQTPIQVGDINFINNIAPTYVQDVLLEYGQRKNTPVFVKNENSLNSSVLIQNGASVNSGLFNHVNDGSAIIISELENGEKYAKNIRTQTLNSDDVNQFSSFVDNSVIKAITEETEQLLTEESSPLSHYAYYSFYGDGNFPRNQDCWLADFDLSGVCVLTGGGNTRMISMITPHFGLGVRHYFDPQYGNESQIGKPVTFVGSQNNTFSTTIESIHYLNGTIQSGGFPFFDIAIIKLNNPVPSFIKKYKTFPTNISSYFPPVSNGRNRPNGIPETISNMVFGPKAMLRMPCVGLSHYRWDNEYPLQRNNRFVYLCKTIGARVTSFQENIDLGYTFPLLTGTPNPPPPPLETVVFGPYNGADFEYIINSDYPNYNGASSWFRGGDSGGPIFCILNNDLVLMGGHINTRFSHLFGGGTQIYLENKINELSNGSEAIETVNLSGFAQFEIPESWENLLDSWTISIN
jgi:hypothetical protein